MALIDVSELLSDPDFVDLISVIRTSYTMSGDGLSVRTEAVVSGLLGSVQPASGDTLTLVPEESRVDGMMEVWTTYPLRQAGEGIEADRILWKGKRLLVTKLDDFGNYGAGYNHAVCTVEGVTS